VARKSLRNVKVPQAIHAVLRMYHSVRAWDSQLSRTTGFVGTGPWPISILSFKDPRRSSPFTQLAGGRPESFGRMLWHDLLRSSSHFERCTPMHIAWTHSLIGRGFTMGIRPHRWLWVFCFSLLFWLASALIGMMATSNSEFLQ